MRILITNDDGVFAPGIAALARGLSAAFGHVHELVVVAPLADHSGAGAAVGRGLRTRVDPLRDARDSWPRRRPRLRHRRPTGPGVILACIEGFGPRPDMVVSGINHGINAGRSALHSGTVGATLTAAQFGVRGLAVSIAWGEDPVPWETPVALAVGILPALAALVAATILNLNVPAVAPNILRGLRHGVAGNRGHDPVGASRAQSPIRCPGRPSTRRPESSP